MNWKSLFKKIGKNSKIPVKVSMTNVCEKAGILVFDQNKNKVLLVTCSGYKGSLWTIPKGNLEADETFPSAAIRELEEETSIKLEGNERIWDLGESIYGKKHKKLLKIFLLIKNVDQEIVLDWENDGYAWVSVKRAMELIYPSQKAFIKEAEKIIDKYNKNKYSPDLNN